MDMQNVSNLTIPEGQVRTIHDKDSRLIWGRVAYNTKYAGDTFRQTYSGKNLFNYQGVVNLAIATLISARSNYRGYYIQANAGDTFTLSRATTTGNNRFRVCFTMVEPAPGVDIYNENGVVERYISADGTTEVSFTVPQDMHYVFIYLSNSGQDITESLKIQLESGSTATSFEPYVGGIPSPNPDYPQDVNVVTGEQTVKVEGKNLAWTGWAQDFVTRVGNTDRVKLETFDGKNCVWWKENTGYGDYDNKYIFKTDFQENTQYTLSCDLYPSRTFSLIKFTYTDGTASGWLAGLTPNTWHHIVMTSTAGKTIKYITAQYHAGGVYCDIDTFQLELGSTATAYEPYQGQSYTVDLGSIELCKIDDYQDYIYKSGDGWYVHKGIGKLNIVSSGIAAFNTHSGSHITVNYSDATVERLSAPAVTNISNRFIGCTSTQTWGGTVLNGVSQGTNNNYLQFSLPISVATTQAEVRTYFANHPTTVYYTLATPTDTKITDATLVGQLNAVHQWVTRYGYNTTVSGDLPIVLQRDSLQ